MDNVKRIITEIVSETNEEVFKKEIIIWKGRLCELRTVYDKDGTFIRLEKAYEYNWP